MLYNSDTQSLATSSLNVYNPSPIIIILSIRGSESLKFSASSARWHSPAIVTWRSIICAKLKHIFESTNFPHIGSTTEKCDNRGGVRSGLCSFSLYTARHIWWMRSERVTKSLWFLTGHHVASVRAFPSRCCPSQKLSCTLLFWWCDECTSCTVLVAAKRWSWAPTSWLPPRSCCNSLISFVLGREVQQTAENGILFIPVESCQNQQVWCRPLQTSVSRSWDLQLPVPDTQFFSLLNRPFGISHVFNRSWLSRARSWYTVLSIELSWTRVGFYPNLSLSQPSTAGTVPVKCSVLNCCFTLSLSTLTVTSSYPVQKALN